MAKKRTRTFPGDFSDLIAAFDAERVQYLVVGGWAVGVHGHPRATKDLDLWIAGSANLERVSRALARFGLPAELVRAARTLGRDEILFFGKAPLRVDLIRSIPGTPFRTARTRAVLAQLGTNPAVPVIGLDDLIRNKRAAGRPQDRADAAALARIAARAAAVRRKR